MNWIDALNKAFKVKDVYGKLKEVKKLSDYGKKLEKKKKLEWDDLKYFENKQMTEATKNTRDAVKAADAALAVKVVWPDPGSLAVFAAALKAADKHGHTSPQAKKAVEAYRKCLVDYEKALQAIVTDLDGKQKQIAEKIKMAAAMEAYCDVLHDAFMACAKIPSIGGTAQNASFFSLSQDAQQLRGEANSLKTRLEKLAKKNAGVIADGKKKIAENKPWIQWASKDATSGPEVLKKNEKAAKPKK